MDTLENIVEEKHSIQKHVEERPSFALYLLYLEIGLCVCPNLHPQIRNDLICAGLPRHRVGSSDVINNVTFAYLLIYQRVKRKQCKNTVLSIHYTSDH